MARSTDQVAAPTPPVLLYLAALAAVFLASFVGVTYYRANLAAPLETHLAPEQRTDDPTPPSLTKQRTDPSPPSLGGGLALAARDLGGGLAR